MDESMINLLLQVPLAGVIVFLVVKFLAHINESDNRWIGIISENRESNKQLFELLNDKVDKVVEGTTKTNEKVDETSDKVDKIDNRLSNIEDMFKK